MKILSFIFFFFLVFVSCHRDNSSIAIKDEKIKYFEEQIALLSNTNDSDCINQILEETEGRMEVVVDSLKQKVLFLLSYSFLQRNDSLHFLEYNNKTIQLSKKLKDTAKMAESYWDLAHFYAQNEKVEEAFTFYSKAQKLYESTEMSYESGKMLLHMAILQKNIKDYTGSELNTIKAIQIFEKLDKFQSLYSCYNNMGIIYNELEEYSMALKYHKLAQKYEKTSSKSGVYQQATLNNIGVVYQNMDQHDLAIKYFGTALKEENLKKRDPQLYAMLIDNLGYSQFKSGRSKGVLKLLNRALLIRDSIGHNSGVTISKIRISEFKLFQGDTLRGENLLFEAKELAKETNNNRDLLSSLYLLSQVDNEMKAQWLERYISLDDSLQKEERTIRNKFARIRFETDEFIAENEQLSLQKKWMIFGFSGLVLFLMSLFVISFQRSKNRELRLVRDQQKANEDIYNLLIDSQTKLEEGQEKEKKRISIELHDGILSQFFGVRLNLELLADKTDRASVEKRKDYVEQLKHLESDIRKVSHQLNIDFLSSEKSFIYIVKELLKQQESLSSFKGDLLIEAEIEWEKFSAKLKINLYRIIQESLHNIVKYAEAKKVQVVFSRKGGKLWLVIQDDGKGFKVEAISEGIGISNIKTRIKDVGGDVFYTSGNDGTKIEINIPI